MNKSQQRVEEFLSKSIYRQSMQLTWMNESNSVYVELDIDDFEYDAHFILGYVCCALHVLALEFTIEDTDDPDKYLITLKA